MSGQRGEGVGTCMITFDLCIITYDYVILIDCIYLHNFYDLSCDTHVMSVLSDMLSMKVFSY